tara:strand:- start:236 stop:472 length:237 start_codon:yes stop_codon:yes gene_type:complete
MIDPRGPVMRFLSIRDRIEDSLGEIYQALKDDAIEIDRQIDAVVNEVEHLEAMRQRLTDFAKQQQFKHIHETDESTPR